VTSTKKAGAADVIAELGELNGKAVLTQIAGDPAIIELEVIDDWQVADGTSTSTLRATVLDANRNPSGAPVSFATDGGQAIGTVTAKGAGVHEATITTSKKSGRSTITATAGSATDTIDFNQMAGDPVSFALALDRRRSPQTVRARRPRAACSATSTATPCGATASSSGPTAARRSPAATWTATATPTRSRRRRRPARRP
jgi:hypothetical protein